MFVTIWEFQPKEGREKQFEDAYGPHGVWAEFFKTGEGYLRTELLQDSANPRRYVTIDYWTSKSAYDAFYSRHTEQYTAIDAICGSLTEVEHRVGSFTTR